MIYSKLYVANSTVLLLIGMHDFFTLAVNASPECYSVLYFMSDTICDPVCEKGSYSLSNCIYMVTHNLTGEYGTSLQFGHSTTLPWQ